MTGRTVEESLPLRGLRLLGFQFVFGGLISFPLIKLGLVSSATAVVLGYAVTGVAYGLLRREAFSDPLQKREVVRVVAVAAVYSWLVLGVALALRPGALANVAQSADAARMVIRVVLGVPVVTFLGLNAALRRAG